MSFSGLTASRGARSHSPLLAVRQDSRVAAAACLAVLGAAPAASRACATCGCTLSADAATGYSVSPGLRASLEYDYVDQDQLRSATHAATARQVVDSPSNPALGGGEIEKQTINRYLTVGMNYSPSADWNFNLLLPYVMRTHTTYGTQLMPYAPEETATDRVSGARFSELGDLKLITSFQGLLPTRNLGVQLGVKLPTGHYGTSVDFASGPGAGTPLDASLQAGTGSTDLIVGGYYFRAVSQSFDAFVNGQFQFAVMHAEDAPGNDYKPGNQATVSIGLRYVDDPNRILEVQLNLSHRDADEGALADRPDTAGTVAYLSPGATVRVSDKLHLYGFVQVPVYRNLDGYQIAPRWTATVGGSYSF
ncbi:MAG TPA: hypothetical protein VIY54_03415 [Steroidobacteraceae bacterium]